MIDLNKETLLTPNQAREVPPRGRRGKRVGLPTLYRWMNDGHHGIRLEFIQGPGCRYTTKEAIHRFLEALTHQAEAELTTPTAPTASRRRREIEAAEAEADQLLGTNK